MWDIREMYIQSIWDSGSSFQAPSILKKMDKTLLIKYLSLSDKRHIIDSIQELGWKPEPLILFIDPINPDSIQGVILESSRIALMDFETFGDYYIGSDINTECIQFKDDDQFDKGSMELLLTEKNQLILKACNKFSLAKDYLDIIKSIGQKAVIDKELSTLLNELIYEIFFKHPMNMSAVNNQLVDIDLSYFGGNARHHSKSVTHWHSEMVDRYFILKGYPGIGKTKILKSLAIVALTFKYSIFLYRCPFYKESLDAIFIPELKTAVLDGTDPHLYEPIHPSDKSFSLNDRVVDEKVIYSHTVELNEANAKYKQMMRQATLYLQEARTKHKQAQHILDNKYKNRTSHVFENIKDIINH